MMLPFLLLSALSMPRIPDEEKGFRPMFNGKNLDGWVNVNCAPSTFFVKDGMVITTGIPTGVLRTKRMYENFIVEFDWMHMKKGGNSGFFIHSGPITVRGQPFTKAFEIQVLDGDDPKGLWTGQGDVFSIHGASFVPDRPHPGGWERCLPSEHRANPYGHWNHYRVESRDGRITLAVNGKVVSGGSKCRPRKGYICIEAEGSECHFKNMRVKELPSTNPGPEEVAEKDQGFVSLYTGVGLSGWKSGPDHKGPWLAKDWILESDRNAGKPHYDLETDKQFGDFELIVDWRLPNKEEKPTEGLVAEIILRSPFSVSIEQSSMGSGNLMGNLGEFGRRQINADRPRGEWNRFTITLRKGRVTVHLNDKTLIENQLLAGVADHGPIGLRNADIPIQFANIYIKPL